MSATACCRLFPAAGDWGAWGRGSVGPDRITTGPLTGIEGTVIRRGKHDQFVAVVRFLGRGATVDLQDWQVEQIVVPSQQP